MNQRQNRYAAGPRSGEATRPPMQMPRRKAFIDALISISQAAFIRCSSGPLLLYSDLARRLFARFDVQ